MLLDSLAMGVGAFYHEQNSLSEGHVHDGLFEPVAVLSVFDVGIALLRLRWNLLDDEPFFRLLAFHCSFLIERAHHGFLSCSSDRTRRAS